MINDDQQQVDNRNLRFFRWSLHPFQTPGCEALTVETAAACCFWHGGSGRGALNGA